MQISRASILFAPLAILFLFGSTLTGDQRLGFRDVSHFYTPLYDYVASRTVDSWLPLWNPLDQTGMPLLGETSTAVLYPVRYALFSLPISSATALAWYVVIHLLIAAFAARSAAIWAGTGELAANLCGLLYSLSGSVLFLYTNPPFLVGAAWLPLVLGVLLVRQPTDDRTRIVIAAPSMAMMILGGDPQMALHAMIVVGGYWFVSRFMKQDLTLSLSVVIAVPVIAALLSAPQVAASVSWSGHSDRVMTEQTGWLEPPATGSRRFESYQFSVAPWHLVELGMPNPSGSLFPTYRRISQMITGDGGMWTPTLYMGVIVLWLLGASIAIKRSLWFDRWLIVAITGFGLSIGHFGLMILIQSLTGKFAGLDSAIGGPYWFLYNFLPGYSAFRYPAKWLPLFALGLAMAAARAFDRYEWRPIGWRWLTGVGVATAAVIAAATIIGQSPEWLFDLEARQRRDEFWGPLDLMGGFTQLRYSALHAGVVLTAIMAMTRLPLTRSQKQLAILLLVAIDLGLAGRSHVATISVAREQSLLAQISPELHANGVSTSGSPTNVARTAEPSGPDRWDVEMFSPGTRWMRTRSGMGWPEVWNRESDRQRMLDVEVSLRTSRFGRWHLADRANMLNSMVSIRSQNMKEFWRGCDSITAPMSPRERERFWSGIRRWLGIEGVIHLPTSVMHVADGDRIANLIDPKRIWSPQHGVFWLDAGVDEQTLAKNNQIEFTTRLSERVAGFDAGEPDRADRTVREITPRHQRKAQRPESVRYDGLILPEAGLLTRPVFQDGNWSAEISPASSNQWQPTVVHQVDRITQGVIMPSGQWDIRFVYHPAWLATSLIIAAASWLGLGIYLRL